MRRSHAIFLGVFLLIWTAMTCAFDFDMLARPIYRNIIAAATWRTTAGTVREFNTEIDPGGYKQSTTYRPIISYDFRVNGQDLVGHRINFTSDFGSSSVKRINRLKAAYPPGATVSVYYDPRKPADAVLSLDGIPTISMMLLFLTPFNAVMIGGWGWLIGHIRARNMLAIAGYRLDRSPERSVFHLTRVSPSAASLYAGGLSSFVGVFLVAFLTDLEPSMIVMVVTWTGIAACAVVAWWVQTRRIVRGRYSLIIDHATRTISIPTRHGPRIDPIEDLIRFESRRDDTRLTNDEPTHQVVAHLRGAGKPIRIAAWLNDETASRLVDGLERELGRDAAPLT